MNTQTTFCVESSSKESFVELIKALPSEKVHTENAVITLPNAITCFGISIDGDHDEGLDLLSLYCAQKGVVWGEFSNKKLYLSDGNMVPVESCLISSYE